MRIRALLLRIGVLLAFAPVFCLGQGLRVEPPWITGFHPLDEAPYEPSPLNARKAVILKLETKMFHDTAQIDFEKRQITFRRVEALGYTMWEYHFGELSDYLASRRNYAFNQSWRKGMTALQPGESAAGRQGLKLEWELPVQYPTWAQRVLGKEPPKLTIDGFLEISFGFENTQYEQKIGAEQNRPTNAPVFDLNYSFTITGSVGRLISVNIRADKEQNFDISDNLKNFKVEYKEATPGELEDEIIQEVIVGYTGFSMPGTNLSGYSESHEGLFGIKIRSRLGPLELTAIASTEQGQSNKKTYSSSGGSGDVPTIEARKFQNDRYFFLDNTYRRYYIQKYAPEGLNPTAPPKVKNLSVWRSFDGWNTDKKSHIRKVKVDAIDQTYPYERLERDKHYYLDDAEGWIRFDDTISFRDDQQVAIFMRTEDTTQFPHLQKGGMKDTTLTDSITGATVLDTIWTLWTLRPMPSQINSAEDDTSRFYLMWRHAYGPGDFSDPASFTLAVKRIGKDGKGSIEQVGTTYFSEILGIADNNNKPYIANTQIFNKQFNDLIFPPFDTSWNGLDVFDNPALDAVPGDEKHRDPTIYRYSKSRMEDKISEGYQDIFEIAMSGSRKKTTFDDLGWGIMKETEIVKGDGVTLKRDEDYTINYDMGIVDLISAKAKACAKIDIEFQSEALFVPERKMFLGSHGKVDLPFLSGKSYAGASVLFQSTQTNEDIPRLDQEPYNKLLLDVNTHIEFEPQWMTGLVNALPLVKTQAPSSVTLDLEFAHSRVNPNKNGSAYIDDFEDSKQSDLLSNSSQSWYLASPPMFDTAITDMSLLLWTYPPAWNFYWFSPRDQDVANRVRRDEIVVLTEEEKKAGMTSSLYEYVLRLHATPSPPIDEYADKFKKAWAGIMTPISQSFANKELVQYFEFFIKADGKFSDKGKLLIQMGQMREDVSLNGREPNRKEDSEDTATILRSQTDEEGLDLGWDLLPDTQEVYMVPDPSTPGEWDTLRYGDPRLGADSLDPAKDNWRQYFYNEWDAGMAGNYRYTCRRQGDGKTTGSSEDINFDGAVQIAIPERYFQFTIDLADSASPFIDRTVNYANPGVWRKYRIPLHERITGYEEVCDTVNDPAWSNITTVRLIWTDFDSLQPSKESGLVFYNMEFVGNQWIEVVDSARIKIRSSVVNTKEDTAYEKIWELKYKNRISRERDEYGYELEQALRLNFVNLAPGDTALVKKNFQYQNLNLSAYERLSLEVFGVDPTDGDITDMPLLRPLWGGDVRFIFRFGTDSLTYYEYGREVLPEWNNTVSIDLKELSNFKDAYMVAHRDSAIEVSDGTLRVHAPAGRQPNFARIQWMALGVIRTNASNGIDSLSGEIWVNEMKLTGVRRINGSASRVDMMTKWADLLSLQAHIDYESGNFRRMTETRNIPDNSQMSTGLGASIGLEKFLPQEWGLSLPAGVTYNSSVMRPQLKNETDVYLVNEKGDPDGFMDIIRDAASTMTGIGQRHNDVTRSEEYQTSSVGRTYYTGYKKTKQENPVIGFLADRWEADMKYSTTIGEVLYGANPDGAGEDAVFAKRDTSDTYSGKVHYDLKPYKPPEWLTWTPFKSIKQEWFPSRMKSYELTLLPRAFDIGVADINFNKQRQRDTWRGVSSNPRSYTVRHNTRIEHTPLSPLCDMNFSLAVSRDLIDAVGDETFEKGRKIFKRNGEWKSYWVLWGERDRTQHAGMRLNPHFFDWLSTSADYASDYNAAVVQWQREPVPYLNTGVKSSLSFEGKIMFDQLFGEFKTAAGKNALAGFFDMMKNGFDQIGLRDFGLSYSAGSNLNNDYVSTGLLGREGIGGIRDLLLFQLGVKGRTPLDILTGEMDDDRFLGMRSRQSYDRPDLYRNDSRTVDRSLRLSSGIAIKALDLSFNQVSLSRSISYTIYPDSTRNDTTITFPDFSAGFSTQMLNKVGFIKDNLQGVAFNSSFTWRRSDHFTSQTGGSSRSDKFDLTPLASVSGTIKRWPIRFDYRHNYSREINTILSETGESADTNRNATMHSDELTVNYEIERSSKLSEIKLLMWTIPIKGRTTVGLKLSRSNEKEVEANSNNKSFSLIPNLSYIFTDNVSGRIDYTFRQEEHGGQKTTTNQLICILKISF